MITDEQRSNRVNSIGSSDVAALFGLSPYTNRMGLYLEKAGRLHPDRTSSAADIGNWLEPALLNWAESGPPRLGALARDVELIGPPLRIHANLDGQVKATREPVEVKVSGIEGPVFGQWGDEGTGEVPSHVALQVHHQMLCADARRGHVVALLGGRGFCYFVIEHDPVVLKMICDAAFSFWRLHVEPGVPPDSDGDLATMDVLKRVRRDARCVPLDPQAYAAWREAREARISWEAKEEDLKRVLITELGTANCGDAGAQGGVSYFRQKKTSIDAHRLKIDHRAAYDACKRTTESPVLRVTKPAQKETL